MASSKQPTAGISFATPPSHCFKTALSNKLMDLNFALRCAICLEPWKQTVALDCGHYFCKPCAVKQLSKREKCPTCGKHCKKRKMQDVPRMDNIVRTVKLLAKSIQVDTECEIPSPFFGSQMSSVQNSSTRRPASHSRTQNNPSGADGQSSQKLGDPVVNKVLKFTTGNVSNLPHQMGATLDPCQQETIQRESPPKDVPLVKVTNNAPLPAFPESTKDSTNAVADATNMVGCTLPRLTRGGSSNAQAITGDSAVFKSPTGRHSRKSTRGTLLANAKLAKHGRDMSPINENASCTEGTRSPSKTVMSTINSTTSKESTSPELVGITEVVAVSESTHTRQRQMQPRARMTRRSSKRGQDVAHDDTTEASLGDFDADMEQALKLSLLESSAGTTPRGMTDTTNSVSGSVTSPATSATATLMQAAQGGGSPGSATHGENTTLGAPSDVLDSSQTQGFELQVSPPLSPRERDAEPGALSCSVAGASGVTQKATAWIASDADKSLVDTKSDFGSVACSSVPLLVDHDLSDDDDESQEQMTNKKRKSRSHHGRAKRVIVDDDDDTDADDDDTGRTNHATSRSHDTTAKAHGSLSDAHKDLDGDDDTEDVGPRVHRTTRTSRARQIVFSSSSAGSGKGTDQTVTADDAALVSPLVRRTGDRRPASKHDNKRNALHRADSSHSSGSSSSGSLPDAGLERRHPAAGDCGALATDRARSAAASKMVLVHDSDGDDTNAHDSDSAHAIGTLRPVENRREPLEAPAKRQSRQTLTRHNAQLLRSKSSTASAAAEMLPSPGCSMPLISPDWQLSAAKSTDDDETASNGLHASRSGAAPHTTNASSVLLTPQGGSGKSEPSPKLSESPMDSEDSQAMLEKLRDIQRQAQQIGDLAPDDSMVQQRVTACVQMQPQYCDARVDNDSLAVATSSLVDPAPVSTHPQSLDMDDMGRATTPSSLQPHVLASAHAQHVPRTVSSPTGDTLRRTSQDDASAAKLTVTRLPTSRSQAQLQTTTDSERTPQSRQPHTPAAPHTSSPAANDVTPPARHAARGAGEGTASGMRARLNVSRMVPTPTKRVRDGPPVVLLTGVDLRADKHKWKAFQKLVTASNGTNVREYSSEVTHLITCADDNNMAKRRTLKLMRAIAEGKWVVNTLWADSCLKHKSFGHEEEFELQGWCDDIDITGGPAKSRVEHNKQRLPLFAGWSFYVHGTQPGAGQDEIVELLKSTGATVLDAIPDVMQPRTAILVSGEWNDVSLSAVDTLDISFVFDSITTYDIRDIDGYRVVSTGDEDTEAGGTQSLF